MRRVLRRPFDGALKYDPILYLPVKQARPIGREDLPLLLHKATQHTETYSRTHSPRGNLQKLHFAPYRNESAVKFNSMVWHVRNDLFVL